MHRKETAMKSIRRFFNYLFSDHGIVDRPRIDGASIMYSYITFSGVPNDTEIKQKTKPDNIIDFNDFKLRRA